MMREEKGQALVEMSLVIPMLLIILVGVFDIGRMIYTYSTLHFTAQETVRLGSFSKGDPEMEQFARNNFSAGDRSELEVAISPSEEMRKPGEYVTVSLTYPVDPFIPVVSTFLPDEILLQVDSTIRIE
ncbi:TadE family protein [Aquibacillus albus]|uniref:TadE-like domain-containing protein n=1 Tax=Aquibacillus albus TaxID=1168171 RepID=A0ABS2N3D6_9BACI|nr:TadE family protein [Aquibacillus albus]MBM7572611.1 hypothetical protein [Aquibacillus albus]